MLSRKGSKVIEKVIQSQVIKQDIRISADDYEDNFAEAPNYFTKAPFAPKGNLAKLTAGMAQVMRVNNPYRYADPDELGRFKNPQPKWSVYKGHEIGGDNLQNSGVMWALEWREGVIGDAWHKKQTARISYHQHSHMHRVPTSLPQMAKCGGPWKIEVEKKSGWKNSLDGFSRSADLPIEEIRGFANEEDAVRYAMNNGWAFDVEKPHFRYHTRKSYADNFKFRPAKN